jgi:hypothetical protein
MSVSYHNGIFELIEKVQFVACKDLSFSIHLNASHSKPHLLLLKDGQVEIISLQSGLTLSTWRFACRSFIRQIKLSSDFMYLGVLKTAKEMEIRTVYQETPIHEFIFDEKISDSILGFEWTFPGELMILSADGITLYWIDPRNQSVSKPKRTKIRMSWYHYWPETNLLIISSGSANLFLYKVLPNRGLELHPNLQITLPRARSIHGIETLPVQITRVNVHVFQIYGQHYIGILNNWFLSPTLSLLRIFTRTIYRQEFELKLHQSGPYSFNVVDNLILAHNMKEKVLHELS